MRHQINLADPSLLPPKPFFQFKTMMMSLGLVIVALLGASLFIQHGINAYESVADVETERLEQRQRQLEERTRSQQTQPKDPALAAELERSRATLTRIEQVLDSVRAGLRAERSAAAALDALANEAGPELWLTRITLQPAGLSLAGYALQAGALPAYLDRLRAQPAFQGLRFGSFEVGNMEQRIAVTATGKGAQALPFRLESVREEKNR